MVRLTVNSGLVFLLSSLLIPLRALNGQSTTPASNPGTTAVRSGSHAITTKSPAQQKSSKRGNQTPEPEVVQPSPPPTPEQMPPSPPKVLYQGDQLTIESQNSTLAQVLRSVQAKIGASIDIPAGANSERVVAQLGPGRPRDVLASLLSGSKFDYIILGVADRPGAVQKVILTTRQSAPVAEAAQNRPMQASPSQETQPDEEYNAPEPMEDNSADNQPQQPPQPGPYRPGNFSPNPGQSPDFPLQRQQPGNPADAQSGVKTPEQLLQELQRLQQQQQMYQQQLNPANQNPQPNFQPQEPQ